MWKKVLLIALKLLVALRLMKHTGWMDNNETREPDGMTEGVTSDQHGAKGPNGMPEGVTSDPSDQDGVADLNKVPEGVTSDQVGAMVPDEVNEGVQSDCLTIERHSQPFDRTASPTPEAST